MERPPAIIGTPLIAEAPGLLERAASGDRAAQREVRNIMAASTREGLCERFEGLVALELWARIAATSGTVDDLRELASALLGRIDYENARSPEDVGCRATYEAEAMQLLSRLADMGDEASGAMLQDLADKASPFAARMAVGLLPVEITVDNVDEQEALAREAMKAGNLDGALAVAGIVFKRGQWAADVGEEETSRAFVVEGTSVLLGLAALGCAEARAHLALIEQAFGADFIAAARRDLEG